jgi:hypothetical protein
MLLRPLPHRVLMGLAAGRHPVWLGDDRLDLKCIIYTFQTAQADRSGAKKDDLRLTIHTSIVAWNSGNQPMGEGAER